MKLEQLKPGSHVERAERFTIADAISNVPAINDPDNVSDIVFSVGFNDSRRGVSPKKICEDTMLMQIAYYKKFKNARQHLSAFIPLSDQQIEANDMLQKHALNTGCNFISMKNFRDRNTGSLRQNLVKGIHFQEIGLRTHAKAIKKSLFSPSNLDNERLSAFMRFATMTNEDA